MATKGIDVSEHNGKLDWAKIKCDFALIRTGFGRGDEDGCLAHNVQHCNVPYGFYHFSYATSVAGAKTEASFVLSLLKKHKAKPTLPVFFDWEYDSDRYAKQQGVTVDKTLFTQMAKAFMDDIQKGGFTPGNYYNHDYYKSYCGKEILDRTKYVQWYAYYGDTTEMDCDIWQFTEKGKVTGFEGDINELRNDKLLSKVPEKPSEKPPAKPIPVPLVNKESRVVREGANIITCAYGNGHGGVDIINVGSDALTAHSAGTVTAIATGHHNDTSGNSYGNYVQIKHGGGYSTLYAHMASVAVKKGQVVRQGQTIGMMGNTGNSYGKHLHFEVRNKQDARINPTPYSNANLPGAIAPPTHSPKYLPGTYRITSEVLTVRSGPGIHYNWIPYENLTANAKAQIRAKMGSTANGYVAGMLCDVSAVKGNWGQTPSGWICLDYCKKA